MKLSLHMPQDRLGVLGSQKERQTLWRKPIRIVFLYWGNIPLCTAASMQEDAWR